MEIAQQARRVAISIVVTRANGTIEDLGVVAYDDLDSQTKKKFDEAIARGQRVDESDLFVPDDPPQGTIRFSGQGVTT